MKKRIIVLLLSLYCMAAIAQTADFVASKIQFIGLQRINQNTAYSYLPIKPGDKVTASNSNEIVQDLYKTGFFSNVQLSRQGNTLLITVDERPVISKIVISGNKVIPTKELTRVLKQMNVAEGYEYNRAVLNNIKTAMINQYYSHGKYNAQVNIQAVPEKNNSVALSIVISEGVTATIKQISIVGNTAFSEKTLEKQFSLTTPTLYSFISHNDQYASEKLEGDIERLRSYYLDRGYLKFQIDSTQVSLTPDRKHVYIVVKVTEGPQYKFAGYDLSGNLILPRDQIQKLITVKKGDVFSRQKVIDAEKAIGDALGNVGYYAAQVKTSSQVDENNKTVFLTFNVNPGSRIYVRHILFTGASNTNDFAFRRVLRQMEGSLISTKAIDESKQRLQSLPFVSNVDVDTQPIQGSQNQVDVNYKMTTVPAGEVKAGVGYSDIDGPMVNAGINQQNVFGTGNQFSTNISYSKVQLQASMSYYNPYFTSSGIGRGFSAYGTHYNAAAANITNYGMDNYGGSMYFNVPLASHDSLQFGLGLDYIKIQASSSPSTIMQNFLDAHGSSFLQIPINVGWTHNTLDRAIFATKGVAQNVGFTFYAPTGAHSLEYYTANYDLTYYQPIYWNFVGKWKTDFGYGNGYGAYKRLPFFRNFYLGGITTVRGYNTNSIGPQDSQGDSVGGNMFFDTSAALIVPNPLSKSLRTSLFVDAGNVYNTGSPQSDIYHTSGRVRFATGVEFDWLSPLGLLNFSIAQAINPTKYDQRQIFQFNIGASV